LKIEKVIQPDRQAKLTVEYPKSVFEGYKKRAARKISKNVKIPGFRPGKASYEVILSHYGEATIIQEAIDILLDDDYAKILEKEEIDPSGTGNLESIESYDPPKFVFMIPLQPEVDLGSYKDIRKDYLLEDFDEKEVDDFIDNLRRNAATIIPADHPAHEGDLVYFNLSGEWLNPKNDEDASITEKITQQAIIPAKGEETDHEWPFKGFARKLNGVTEGQTKEIQHKYPKTHENEDYQGKTALFTIEVQSVKELELPEFNEDFVKSLGSDVSPETFRENAETRLRGQHKTTYEQQYIDELLNEITEQSKLNYPPQMLAHEEEHVLEDVRSRLENQGMEFDTYLQLRDKTEETFKEEEIQPVAKQRLERSLIVDALIDAESLKLDQDLLKENINKVMSEVLYSGDMAEMQKKMGQDQFSRAISMEGVQRTMNDQLQERMILIATGQPIPEEDETPEKEIVAPNDEEEESEPSLQDEQPVSEDQSEEATEEELEKEEVETQE
jgi:trigger factor